MRNKKFVWFLFCLLFFTGATTIGTFLIQKRWGLLAEYYANMEWKGTPSLLKIDNTPYLRGETSHALLSTNRFSVKWKGWIDISHSGTYRFTIVSDDGSSLWIDGKQIIDNSGFHGKKSVSENIFLHQGIYPIEILYFQGGGYSVMETFWLPPDKPEGLLPSHVLFSTHPGKVQIFLRRCILFYSVILKFLWVGFLLLGIAVCIVIFCKDPIMFSLKVYCSRCGLSGILLLCTLVAWTTYFSPVDYSWSDTLGNLLTSQAILQHRTVKLDEYQGKLPGYIKGWHLRQKQDHLYYHYPVGTPVVALPFVSIANVAGLDMANREHDAFLQNILSMLSTTIACLLIYAICRYYASLGYSLLFTGTFVLGSSIISTMGTGLWSINFSLVFVLFSLILILYDNVFQRFRVYSYLTGLSLFLAYLCRPTSILFLTLIVVYIALIKRAMLVKVMAVIFLCLALFMIFSWSEYQQILPDYYLPQQLGGTSNIGTALWGHLVSPSRGVLIYSPYLFLSILGSLVYIRQLYRQPLFWVTVLWIGLHLLLISRNSMWWGGGCFGSRMFTDAMPAFLLLTLLLWYSHIKHSSVIFRRIVIGIFLLFASIGIYINTYQGLYNTYTLDWGVSHLFDWKCPQFLASHACLAEREFQDQKRHLDIYTLGDTIYPDSNTAIFSSWYWVQNSKTGKFRWSRGNIAKIFFKVASSQKNQERTMILELQISSYQQQRVILFLNEKQIGQFSHSGNEPSSYKFPVAAAVLKNSSDEYNSLIFELPDAIEPRKFRVKGWVRALAINIRQLRLFSGEG